MPNKFKLLKDLPGIKAGTIFNNADEIPYPGELSDYPDWFQPIPEKWPKKGDKFWFIRVDLTIALSDNNPASAIDAKMIEVGNCFRTEQQAQKAASFIEDVLSGRLYEQLDLDGLSKLTPYPADDCSACHILRDKMNAFLEEE